jgi:tetratricopeptide (TPR) repeat protein
MATVAVAQPQPEAAKQFTSTTRAPASPAGQNGAAVNAQQQISPELRADILMARKMYREAIDYYLQAPQDSAVIMNKIGIAHHQLTELQLAKKYYEKASKLKPDYAEAINNLGTVYYAQKNYRRAIASYKKAIDYSPTSASMLMNLGTAYFARKNYDLAFATYQDALKLDPEVFEHRGTNGTLLQERSVEERAKFHFYLARTYAKAGATDRALMYLRKALEEGFKEKDKIYHGPEFAALKELDEFKQIMAMEQKVL